MRLPIRQREIVIMERRVIRQLRLQKLCEAPKGLNDVPRILLPFLAIIAILFGSVLSLPDVHAEEGESFAHAADHLYAHGGDHFDTEDTKPDHEGQNHTATHHHSCSFSLADNGALLQSAFSRSESLKGPLATSSLASRAPPVLIQPPKA